jgi:hypothetical protein
MNYSQKTLLDEGFWNFFKPSKSPILKGIGKAAKLGTGALMGATKGIAKTLDYVAPEITQPLHRFEAGVRDIGDATRRGFDVGYGGLQKEYADILLDAGYLMDPSVGVVDSGKNKVVVGYRIIGHDGDGNPIPDKNKKISFLFDRQNNVKIIKTSEQDTTSLVNSTKTKIKPVTSKKQKSNKPRIKKFKP